MDVERAMQALTCWIEAGTSVPEAAKRIREGDVGPLLVGENDRLLGIVMDEGLVLSTLA